MTLPKLKKKRRRKKRRGHYHRGVHVSPKAGECSYRSGWELSFMEWLDVNDEVKTYSYEKTIIEYVSNLRTGKRRKYFPDFLVEFVDRTELIEIKPSSRVKQAKVQKKIAAAIGWCEARGIQFKVMTEKELKPLGLIKRSST